MTSYQKQQIIIYLAVATLLIALLASSLSQMALLPGLPAPALEGGRVVIPEAAPDILNPLLLSTFFWRVLAILLASSMLWVAYALILGTDWKKLVKYLGKYVLIAGGCFSLLLAIYLIQSLPFLPATHLSQAEPPALPAFTALEPPPAFLIWLVGAGLTFLVAFLLKDWIMRRRQPEPVRALAGQIATAEQEMLAGLDCKGVILRCYGWVHL